MSESKSLYETIIEPLHPAEQALIEYIRTMRFGSLTIKVQHGLPEVGEHIRESVKFNVKGGR